MRKTSADGQEFTGRRSGRVGAHRIAGERAWDNESRRPRGASMNANSVRVSLRAPTFEEDAGFVKLENLSYRKQMAEAAPPHRYSQGTFPGSGGLALYYQ